MKAQKLFLYITIISFFFLAPIKSDAHFGTKGPFGGSVSCLTVNDSVVYIGTYTGGVYESTNSQLIAWRARPVGLHSGKINALAHTGSYLFAATDSGIYRFTGFIGNDRYWESVNNGLPTMDITSLVALDSITVLAGTTGHGVYKTNNKGISWDSSNTNMMHYDVNALVRAGSRIVQISNGGLWASDNNGLTWFDFNDINTANINATTVSYNATNDEVLVHNTSGLFLLQSASTTGTPVYVSIQSNLPVGAVVRSISNNGTTWYLATDQGVFTSQAGLINWTSENTGINTQDVSAIVSFPFTGGLVAGTNNQGIYKTHSSAISWSVMNTGFNNLATYSMIASDSLTVIAATEKGVFVSKNLATSYASANNGLTDSLHVNDLVFFGSTLIAATLNAGIFISADTGTTWTPYNTNLSVMGIRKVKSSSSYAYLINSSGEIFQSDLVNGWTMIQGGLPGSVIPTSMAFHNGNILLGTYGDGIYIKPESGGTWAQNTTGLSNFNVTSVTVNNQNKIFAGTDGNGVFVSDATTINWTPASVLLTPFTTTMGLDGSKVQDMSYYAGYTFASCRGQVFATSDNGVTWIDAGTQFNLPSYADTRKLSFVTTRLFTTTPNNSLYSNGLSELPVISGIAENSNATSVFIYPNPGSGTINLRFDNPSEKIIEASIFDNAGRLVKQFTGFNAQEISVDLKSGIYFLKVTTNNGISNQKIIIN